MTQFCDDTKMSSLIQSINGQDNNDDIESINALLKNYPEDPRLHFLKGSCLAGHGQLIEAHASFSRAVDIAPDYSIARFQLGFFQLTSGESNNALKTWARLDTLPDDNYLKVFVIGLRHLIRDEFKDCIQNLQKGIALNAENPPLNNDMLLIINECNALLNNGSEGPENAFNKDDVTSATSALLGQFTDTDTQH